MSQTDSVRRVVADIREYEQSKLRFTPEMTAQQLSEIVAGIAARDEAELAAGLRKAIELEQQKMKLQRWEFIPSQMGGKMVQMEDGDYCESSEVEQLEHVAQLVLVSPVTGKPLEVCSDLLAEGPFTVFYVDNKDERFKVRISMEEV
jgi:hypothetical protein